MSISVLQRERETRFTQSQFSGAGIPCELSDISAANYVERLTPLLIEIFNRLSDPMLKLEVAQKLALSSKTPEVEKLLLAAFAEDVPSSALARDSYRWGLASVLESIASKQSTNVSSYLEFATDGEKYGKSREMIVLALAKLDGATIDDALIGLLADDGVYGHAIIALGKRKSEKALPSIRRFEVDPKPWVRKEALKARSRIERATKR
jgi:hypothetical protein